MIRERTVVLVLVEAYSFSVFLNKSKHNTSSPFFGVEVVEFCTLTNLMFFWMSIELGVGGSDHQMKEWHPSTGKVFDVGIDFIVNCFPEEFNAQINKLMVLPFIKKFQQTRKHAFEEVEEVLSLLFSDAELKASCDG